MLKNRMVSITRIFVRPVVSVAPSSREGSRPPQNTRRPHYQARPRCADSALCAGGHFKWFSSPAGNGDEDMILPDYAPRLGEALEVKRARLLYQSRKRGMLENGLLLSTFASTHLNSLTSSQLELYDDIINRPSNDWQLYYWMTGREETPADYDNVVMDMLKSHARNNKLEARIRQPDL